MNRKINSSFYFQHDYNAANDVKVLYLRQQLGIEGYGIFWFVIEQLALAGGKLPLKVIPVIAMQIQTTIDKVSAVVKNYELFEIENEEFFSIRLLQQIEFRKQLSIDGRAGVLKRWENKRKNSPPITPPNSPPNTKERKGKERKEKEIITLPFGNEFALVWETWVNYRSEIKKKLTESTIKKQLKKLSSYSEESAIKMINQSIENGWHGIFPVKEDVRKQVINPYKIQ